MNYIDWNNAIGSRFFNADRSGLRVFLFVTRDVLDDIGEPYNEDADDFIHTVKHGPPWNTRQGRGICQQALQAYDNWRKRNLEYPPYLCYLSLFVWADGVDAGFAKHAYYPGLRKLLGEEPEAGMYPSFNQMYRLWDDLAVWSNVDMHGELGLFDADLVGEWMHVGLPRAQTFLTDEERESLPLLFADNGLDPNSPPSERELSYLLSSDRNHYLRPRTKELLSATHAAVSAVRSALVETIYDELENWDGTTPCLPDAPEQIRNSLGNLRLAMVLDRTARLAHFYLRCRSNRAYPDEGLRLVSSNEKEVFYCFGDWNGWSIPLYVDEVRTRIYNASLLNWRDGLRLADNEHAWRASLSKRPVRIMVSASQFGFDGYIEESLIPHGKPFYLLAHSEHAELLKTWGNNYCTGFSEVENISGVPTGWDIYSIERANSDAIVRDVLPYLAFPNVLRIRFRGGLKIRGNQYFTFALPLVEVTGVADYAQLFCNGRPLHKDPETGLFSLPSDLCSRRLIVEVRCNGECIRRRSLYALETVAWLDREATAKTDKFGITIGDEETGSCTGIIVDNYDPPAFSYETFMPPTDGNRLYLIGRNPGEVVVCPREPIPDSWKPVWAVSMKKRGKGCAIYCGSDLGSEKPTQARSVDGKRVRNWREVLWYKRKQISVPSHPQLRALWNEYREVAHRVR
jgi:hypothetical protein